MIPKPKKQPKNRIKNEWLAFRRKWLRENPPDWAGFYVCGICGNKGTAQNMDLDHIQKRSLRPDLRLDKDNVRLVCRPCHNKKHELRF